MKVGASVRKICEKCRLIRRRGRICWNKWCLTISLLVLMITRY